MKKIYFVAFMVFCLSLKTRAQLMHDTVSREDKLYALSKIWKEADYNFVFFDKLPHLNWDSLYMAYIPKILATRNVYEYYKVLSSFIGTLRDGHTSVMTNQFYWNDIDSPPVRFITNNGKRYVIAVDETLKNEVPVGSEITLLNGKTWRDFLAGNDLENNDWFGFQNSTIELTLLSPDKRTLKTIVKRNSNVLYRAKTLKWLPDVIPTIQKNFVYKELSPQVAYVAINTFGDSTIVKDFEQALPEIRKHKNLIVDIRQNQGGNDDYATQVAKYITDQPFMISSMWMARTNNSAQKAWSASNAKSTADYLKNGWDKHPGETINIPQNLQRLNMPVYVLTSKSTFSAAEDFLIYLNGSKNVTRIGQNSGGSSGQPLVFSIPKGFSARVCAKRDALPDGTDFIGIGIKPDIYVEPFFSLTGEVKDVELDKALEIIAAKNK